MLCFLFQDTMWQFGVFGVLLVWLNVVNSLNKIPDLNVFAPISSKFCIEYLKLVFLIFWLIMAFAVPFNLLLGTVAPGFSSIPYSLMKTLSWMFGDLAYNDTFLSVQAPLKYPIQANIFFSFFIIVFGVVIFNLFVRDPTVTLTEIRNNAAYYEANSTLKMILFLDDMLSYRGEQTLGTVKSLHVKKIKTPRTKF